MASLYEYQKRIVEEIRKRKSVTIEIIPRSTAKNQTVTDSYSTVKID